MATRKAIAAALLAQLTTGGAFTSTGRRLRDPENAAAPNAPALFLVKDRESYQAEDGSVPPVRTLNFLAVIYTDVGSDETAVPADVIDDLLDVIDANLKPSVADALDNGGFCSLGGIVYSAYVSGEPEIAPGDKAGKGVTAVPIKVVLKAYP